jgi:Adaptive response protein AidB N-terminal domain
VQNAIEPDLVRFGDEVLTRKVLNWTADAERNTPYLKTWDSWGKRKDELVTGEGWRNLQEMGISEGVVAIPYEGRYGEHSRCYQFAKCVILPSFYIPRI